MRDFFQCEATGAWAEAVEADGLANVEHHEHDGAPPVGQPPDLAKAGVAMFLGRVLAGRMYGLARRHAENRESPRRKDFMRFARSAMAWFLRALRASPCFLRVKI